MYDLIVVNTGKPQLDSLHALGLAKTIAMATDNSVVCSNVGTHYLLEFSGKMPSVCFQKTLRSLFPIPFSTSLENSDQREIQFLDGLLGAAFTMPGPRVVSVADVLCKAQDFPSVIPAAVEKASALYLRIDTPFARSTKHKKSWLHEMVSDYEPRLVKIPELHVGHSQELCVTMPLEPTLALAPRRQVSDCVIGDRTSVKLNGSRFAPALVYIGAACFLRAQRVRGGAINMYVPIINDAVITPDTYVPCLAAGELRHDQALVRQCLSMMFLSSIKVAAVSFQTLMPLGSKQSISVNCGVRELDYLRQYQTGGCGNLVNQWLRLLDQNDNFADDKRILSDWLISNNSTDFVHHLRTTASRWLLTPDEHSFTYDYVQLRVMLELQSMEKSHLARILERENGTIRFARALRHLGQLSRADLLDLIDELEFVKTEEQLLLTLAHLVQRCELAWSRSMFIIVPTEDDFAFLIDDMEHCTPRELAVTIILLASVRYPSKVRPDAGVDEPLPTLDPVDVSE